MLAWGTLSVFYHPPKNATTSRCQGIFGVWIWNTKFRLDKGECVQQNFHWKHSPTDSKYFTLKTQVNWDGGKNLSGDGSRSKVLYRPKHFQCCNPMQKLMTRSQPENFGKQNLSWSIRSGDQILTWQGNLLWKDTKNPRKIIRNVWVDGVKHACVTRTVLVTRRNSYAHQIRSSWLIWIQHKKLLRTLLKISTTCWIAFNWCEL